MLQLQVPLLLCDFASSGVGAVGLRVQCLVFEFVSLPVGWHCWTGVSAAAGAGLCPASGLRLLCWLPCPERFLLLLSIISCLRRWILAEDYHVK